VGQFLFSKAILHGLLGTAELTAVSMALAIALGFVLAALGASPNPVLASFVRLYVWIFRGVPLIVQILAWYNLALVFPLLAIGLPFSSWHLQGSTNKLVTPFLASRSACTRPPTWPRSSGPGSSRCRKARRRRR
jgi:polar amino acid transport system permease protein